MSRIPGHTPIPRHRPWAGPAILKQGFRPFFLLAGLWAVVALAAWVASLEGSLVLPSAFDPLTWHAHEMLFGFIGAAVTGFLLTAIPNWTGRMPLDGWGLLGLVVLFVAARVAVAVSALVGPWLAAALDVGFQAVLLAVVAREIAAGRNWRNAPMAVALSLLLAGNALMHVEALGLAATAALGWHLGIAVMVLLVALIGGRITPSFTRNWLVKRGESEVPAAFSIVDKAAMVTTVLWGVAWVVWPERVVAAVLAAAAGLALLLRLARWRGHRTAAEPLVTILHLAYLWLPLGLGLIAASHWVPAVLPTAGTHALTAGGMAMMIAAVMTRASLGHTGRALTAGTGTIAVYVLVALAAVLRVLTALDLLPWETLRWAGAAWVAGFGLFVALYVPVLAGRGPSGK